MDRYSVIISKEGTMEGYKSMTCREFDYADLGIGEGIQVSRECNPAYEEELKSRISKIFEAFESLYELKENYNFLNPAEPLTRDIHELSNSEVNKLNNYCGTIKFDSVEDLKNSFNSLFKTESEIKDYINLSLILEGKGFNVRSL